MVIKPQDTVYFLWNMQTADWFFKHLCAQLEEMFFQNQFQQKKFNRLVSSIQSSQIQYCWFQSHSKPLTIGWLLLKLFGQSCLARLATVNRGSHAIGIKFYLHGCLNSTDDCINASISVWIFLHKMSTCWLTICCHQKFSPPPVSNTLFLLFHGWCHN